MSLQRKILVSHLGSVMLNMNDARQCGIHVTKMQNRDVRNSTEKCAEVGFVRQVHTLFVRSAQQVVHELQVRVEVEGVRQEVREVKRESKVEESRSLHEHMWMTWMTNTRLMT